MCIKEDWLKQPASIQQIQVLNSTFVPTFSRRKVFIGVTTCFISRDLL